jgi:hypothetical protein
MKCFLIRDSPNEMRQSSINISGLKVLKGGDEPRAQSPPHNDSVRPVRHSSFPSWAEFDSQRHGRGWPRSRVLTRTAFAGPPIGGVTQCNGWAGTAMAARASSRRQYRNGSSRLGGQSGRSLPGPYRRLRTWRPPRVGSRNRPEGREGQDSGRGNERLGPRARSHSRGDDIFPRPFQHGHDACPRRSREPCAPARTVGVWMSRDGGWRGVSWRGVERTLTSRHRRGSRQRKGSA